MAMDHAQVVQADRQVTPMTDHRRRRAHQPFLQLDGPGVPINRIFPRLFVLLRQRRRVVVAQRQIVQKPNLAWMIFRKQFQERDRFAQLRRH